LRKSDAFLPALKSNNLANDIFEFIGLTKMQIIVSHLSKTSRSRLPSLLEHRSLLNDYNHSHLVFDIGTKFKVKKG
jgi:hypothetical protein